MTQQDRKPAEFAPSSPSALPIVLACMAVTAAAYFGMVRPAQEHMRSLERQCNKLVVAVKKLQAQDETARHGLQLINLLDAQAEKLAAAEEALDSFADLRERMTQEAESLTSATAALRQLETVRQDVDRYSKTLTVAAATLGEMAEVSAAINSSREIAREANGSLTTLGELQTDLAGSIAQLSQQVATLELHLQNRSQSLPEAERTLSQIDQLCQQLADESREIGNARIQIGELGALKDEVLMHASNVPAAEAALDKIWDLKDGLLQAQVTLDKAQQLAVDMMLLEPVFDQVSKSLKPMADSTRLSRRAAAKAPKTPGSEHAEVASPWTSAINLFVAWMGGAK